MGNIGKCLVCERLRELVIFKIGKTEYKLCKDCKKKIKQGLKLQCEFLDSVMCEDLLALRKMFLRTLGHAEDWIENRIKYERVRSSNGNGGIIKNKSRCMICGSHEQINLIVPKFISMFVNDLKLGIPLCSKCKKETMCIIR